MIIDSKALFFENEDPSAAAVSGTIDLYGSNIAEWPNSELRKKPGIGNASNLLVHVVASNTGGTALSGTAIMNLYLEDGTDPSILIQSNQINVTEWEENAGFHHVFTVPSDVEGRYIKLELETLATADTATAWLSAQ